MRLRTIMIAVIATVAGGSGTAIAAAPSGSVITTFHSGKLAPGQTKTFTVSYLDAGEYPGKNYTGTVKLTLSKHGGAKPSLKLVKIKRKGNVKHGADFAATVENSNRSGTAPVTVEVIASTLVTGVY